MPSTDVTTAYENALPDDERIQRKKMFESPCAFINRQMFFGTFEDTIVARIGPERVAALAVHDGMQVFTLSADKQWDDYIQLEMTVDPNAFPALAKEALAWTEALPKKMKRPRR